MSRQINSTLTFVEKVSTAALMLFCSSSGKLNRFLEAQLVVDFAKNVALEVPNGRGFFLSVFGAFLDSGLLHFCALKP
ncbi:hypothetical protein OIU14_01815 [Thalassobacter stenotrophicus]|uniref:hypothetical protein n=1 Tax=Thalassobacter stenotrophicus TaxID=266809 RepID=UPI0022A92F56|nr:hypothetical protein [Thalassobacter stenotrophicus]UYP68506.1 hypothetical protein OIU14_01815 [Thalassobacter stenotrophicus]